MIPRYSTLEMSDLWSDKTKFTKWAEVEAAVLLAKYKLGFI